MEVRQLEHLVAAVEEGTLGAAAERCHISQPGLSMSLRRLEDTVGVELLERRPRGVVPTPAGEALARHARIALSHLRHAAGEIDALRGGTAGELRVGVGASFMNRALPRVAARLLVARPDFHLHVVEGVAEDQIPRLLRGELDLVLVRFPSGPPRPELVYEALHRRRLLAWVRATHPLLSQSGQPALEDLMRWPWITPDDAPEEIAGLVYRALQSAGPAMRPTLQSNSVPFIIRLLHESDAIALLPEGAVADEAADRTLVGLPLPGVDLDDEVGAAYRRELRDLPVLVEIVSALREELPRLGLVS